jgi:dihydrofolate synthase/folylpolyglutamate synthase
VHELPLYSSIFRYNIIAMTEIKDFAEAEKALARFIPPAGSQRIKYDLDRMRALMECLGNPQNDIRIIHVAGTSGKTSTCYYLSALLQAAGQKVGLTISPYVESVNERLQIDLEPLPKDQFVAALNEFLPLVETTGLEITYFEVLIALAYWYFARTGVDYAVVEVGLGGLLDGTNVISREDKVCIITDIGLDHTEILGDTLGQIAAQKAGIITSHNQVFMYEQGDEVMDVVGAACSTNEAILNIVSTKQSSALPQGMPQFQKRNWTLAKAAVDHVCKRDILPEPPDGRLAETMRLQVPARMEKFTVDATEVILDGAHNPQKLSALLSSLGARYPGRKFVFLLALLQSPQQKLASSVDILSLTHSTSSSLNSPQGRICPRNRTRPRISPQPVMP